MTTRIGELPYEVDEARRHLRSRVGVGPSPTPMTVQVRDVRLLLDALDQWPEPVWPARAWVYGTWGNAVSQAREHAGRHRQRVWVYAAHLDGEPAWVASLDPRREQR